MHQQGKRKKADLPAAPPPAKASFRSTECLLLSLLRQGTCDEAESPMTDVLSGKLQSRLAALKGGSASGGDFGGSCVSLNTASFVRHQTKSCSLETILDDCAPLTCQQLFLSTDSLALCSTRSHNVNPAESLSKSTHENALGGANRNRLSVVSVGGLSVAQRPRPLRPCSVGSCLDIVIETQGDNIKETRWQGQSTSCLNVNAPAERHRSSSTSRPPSLPSSHPLSSSSLTVTKVQGSSTKTGPMGPRPTASTSNLSTHSAPAVVRRCLSSVDVSKPLRPASQLRASVCVPTRSSKPPQPKPEHSKTLSMLPICVCACVSNLIKLTASNI